MPTQPANVLAMIRRDVYEKETLPSYSQPARVGALVPLRRWQSNNKELEALRPSGTLWVITVRPGGRVWLVACYRDASVTVSKKPPYYRVEAQPNDLNVADITDIVGQLRFTNRKQIDMTPHLVAHSAQTMGILTPESVQLLRKVSSNDRWIDHPFRLRPDLDAILRLPPDLTEAEAERIGAFAKTLVIARDFVQTHAVETASAPGLGPSTSRPMGKRLVLPEHVNVRGAMKGGASDGTRVGSGAGHVDIGLELSGGESASTVVMPAGLVMISQRPDVQNGLLVQDVRMEVPSNAVSRWVLAMYCANQTRSAADEGAEFTIGPVLDDPALRELFDMLVGKVIPSEKTETVQRAVWEITDGQGLSSATRDSLAELPSSS